MTFIHSRQRGTAEKSRSHTAGVSRREAVPRISPHKKQAQACAMSESRGQHKSQVIRGGRGAF